MRRFFEKTGRRMDENGKKGKTLKKEGKRGVTYEMDSRSGEETFDFPGDSGTDRTVLWPWDGCAAIDGILGDFIPGILFFFCGKSRGRDGDPVHIPVVANSFDW